MIVVMMMMMLMVVIEEHSGHVRSMERYRSQSANRTQVAAALEEGAEVTLDYKPGSVRAIFKAQGGESHAVSCEW